MTFQFIAREKSVSYTNQYVAAFKNYLFETVESPEGVEEVLEMEVGSKYSGEELAKLKAGFDNIILEKFAELEDLKNLINYAYENKLELEVW